MGGGLSALDEATKEGKRPGRKGGEQEKEEGREKPGAAPPGEPRAAAGTFVSAPNSQPGKRELEREEERGGGEASANLGREKEAAAYLWLSELEPLSEPHPSRPAHGRGTGPALPLPPAPGAPRGGRLLPGAGEQGKSYRPSASLPSGARGEMGWRVGLPAEQGCGWWLLVVRLTPR